MPLDSVCLRGAAGQALSPLACPTALARPFARYANSATRSVYADAFEDQSENGYEWSSDGDPWGMRGVDFAMAFEGDEQDQNGNATYTPYFIGESQWEYPMPVEVIAPIREWDATPDVVDGAAQSDASTAVCRLGDVLMTGVSPEQRPAPTHAARPAQPSARLSARPWLPWRRGCAPSAPPAPRCPVFEGVGGSSWRICR